MATLVRFLMADGKAVDAISYRMDTSLDAGVQRPRFNVETTLGWVVVLRSDVKSVVSKMGRPT